jgi:DNA-binding beta-propeller fold protein YncE
MGNNIISRAGLDHSFVAVIDGSDNATSKMPVGQVPYFVAVNEVTNKIYVPNLETNDVTVIDGTDDSTNTVTARSKPIAVAVNETTDQIFVMNFQGQSVTAIDGDDNHTTTISVGKVSVACGKRANQHNLRSQLRSRLGDRDRGINCTVKTESRLKLS